MSDPIQLNCDVCGGRVDVLMNAHVDPSGMRWTPSVGQILGLNKVVGLAARKTLIGLARPRQLFNYLMY